MEHEFEMRKINNAEDQYSYSDEQVKHKISEDPLRFVRDKGKP
jgi:hypothetical protein